MSVPLFLCHVGRMNFRSSALLNHIIGDQQLSRPSMLFLRIYDGPDDGFCIW